MRLKLLGAVIAGGRARRFGSDKAVAQLDGRTLLDHVIGGLAPQVDATVICGREVVGHICLTDRPAPDLGPLAGLSAALRHAAFNGFDAVLTSACDTPLVPADLATRLAGPDPAVAVGQPLFGYWPAVLANELEYYLGAAGSLRFGDWVAWTGARRVLFDGELVNINTPADLTELNLQGLAA